MFEGLKNIKRMAKGALIAGAVLAPSVKANAQQVEKYNVSISQTENKDQTKEIFTGVERLEAQFKSLSTKEIKASKPTYVIISQSEVLGSLLIQNDSLMNEKLIASSLIVDVVNNGTKEVDFISRDQGFAQGVNMEKNMENEGLIAMSEVRERTYMRPDAYIIISQKTDGDVLTFSAQIASLDTKNVETVSVSAKAPASSVSIVEQEELLTQLKQLVQEKIK